MSTLDCAVVAAWVEDVPSAKAPVGRPEIDALRDVLMVVIVSAKYFVCLESNGRQAIIPFEYMLIGCSHRSF